MRKLALAILFASATAITAQELPTFPDGTNVFYEGFCNVDTHPGVRGYCRLLRTPGGGVYLIFFDSPNQVLFVRSSKDSEGQYHYLYERAKGETL